MLRNPFYLALATALIVAPGVANASTLSRADTAPDGAGRWVNRRLTIRHQDTCRRDNFVARAFTERKEEGRWLNRRFTFRHEGQDSPKFVH